jgi:shikimate kinase
MRIVFIGFRCTGKTTLSKRLSKELSIPRFSTDELVEKEVGNISQFVNQNGWPKFRAIEKLAIESLSNKDSIILDTGGGVIENPGCMDLLKESHILTKVIWLKSDLKLIEKILSTTKDRPPLEGSDPTSEIERIYKRREPLYKRYADFTLDTTDWDEDQLTKEIIAQIR